MMSNEMKVSSFSPSKEVLKSRFDNRITLKHKGPFRRDGRILTILFIVR